MLGQELFNYLEKSKDLTEQFLPFYIFYENQCVLWADKETFLTFAREYGLNEGVDFEFCDGSLANHIDSEDNANGGLRLANLPRWTPSAKTGYPSSVTVKGQVTMWPTFLNSCLNVSYYEIYQTDSTASRFPRLIAIGSPQWEGFNQYRFTKRIEGVGHKTNVIAITNPDSHLIMDARLGENQYGYNVYMASYYFNEFTVGSQNPDPIPPPTRLQYCLVRFLRYLEL